MSERQGQIDEHLELHQGMLGQVEELMGDGRRDVYRLSRIERVGVFHIPEEFVWRNHSLIAPEDRNRLFTHSSVHLTTRHPLRLALDQDAPPKKRKWGRRQEESILEILGSTMLTLSLAYPNEWRTTSFAETRLHLEGEQATLARSRKVEVPYVRNGREDIREVTLHEETPRIATTDELQVFSAMMRYIKQIQLNQDRIVKADTKPLLRVPLMSTDPPIHHL